jgi:hypothetical protein
MPLADNERREQAFTLGESRSRLRFGVWPFYTQMYARSNHSLCVHTGWQCPKNVWFRHGHF